MEPSGFVETRVRERVERLETCHGRVASRHVHVDAPTVAIRKGDHHAAHLEGRARGGLRTWRAAHVEARAPGAGLAVNDRPGDVEGKTPAAALSGRAEE